MASNNIYVSMNKANDECFTRLPDALDMFKFLQGHINLRNKIIWMPFNDEGKNIEKAAHSLKIYKTVGGGGIPLQRAKGVGYYDI